MRKKEDGRAQIDNATDTISTQVRLIALTIISMSAIFLFKTPDHYTTSVEEYHVLLIVTATLSFLALVIDYVHYVFSTVITRKLLKHVSDKNDNEVVLEEFLWGKKYVTMRFCFWAKQAVLWVSIIFFIITCILILKTRNPLEKENNKTLNPSVK